MLIRALFILIGGGLLIFSVYRFWKLIDLQRRLSARVSWILTTGEVYKREVRENWGSKGGPWYEPVISYRYKVMGSVFKNSLSFGFHKFIGSAKRRLAEVEDNIDVHYNPDRPKDHISIEEKISGMYIFNTLLFLCSGLAFISIGLFMPPISVTGTGTEAGHGHLPK